MKALIVQLADEFYINLVHDDSTQRVGDTYNGQCLASYSVRSANRLVSVDLHWETNTELVELVGNALDAIETLHVEDWSDYTIAEIISQ